MKASVKALDRKGDCRDSVGSLHFTAQTGGDGLVLAALYKRYFLPDLLTKDDWKILKAFSTKPAKKKS
jgi:hypothetical protein